MLFERIESKGLAHYSYLIGDGAEAVVIDPRRDCEIYIHKATQQGMRIAHVLETHRNEDYVVGSIELATRTGAQIWHADAHLDYQYGQAVEDGQTWPVGRLKIQALLTPGHTLGSMSYLLHDPDGAPWVIFSGDVLFAGEVGRVDFMGTDRLDEMAGLLYDSLFEKILPLGDGVIVCPAHGAGSVCGSAIAERVWTTVGLERRLNPKLQFADRETFIAQHAQDLEKSPHFHRMEKLNVEGPPLLGRLPTPPPLSPEAFARAAKGATVLDTRLELSFGAAHVPDALSIWLDGISSFAGWFLPDDRPTLLVNETDDPTPAVRYLIRLGYDDLVGSLSGGLHAWHKAGQASHFIGTLNVQQFCYYLDAQEGLWILDVRGDDELETEGEITGAHHIHLTELPGRLSQVPRDRPIYVFCGSGLRSMIAASLLQREGWQDVMVILGGLSGWTSHTCPIEL